MAFRLSGCCCCCCFCKVEVVVVEQEEDDDGDAVVIENCVLEDDDVFRPDRSGDDLLPLRIVLVCLC